MISAAFHPYPSCFCPVAFELPVQVRSAFGSLNINEIDAYIFGTGTFQLVPIDFCIVVRNIDTVDRITQRQLDPELADKLPLILVRPVVPPD